MSIYTERIVALQEGFAKSQQTINEQISAKANQRAELLAQIQILLEEEVALKEEVTRLEQRVEGAIEELTRLENQTTQ